MGQTVNSSSIIGNPIRIVNLLVAQNDLRIKQKGGQDRVCVSAFCMLKHFFICTKNCTKKLDKYLLGTYMGSQIVLKQFDFALEFHACVFQILV